MKALILVVLTSLLLEQILAKAKIFKDRSGKIYMALLKFGVIVVEMRGKSGGNVFSKNAAGNYMKNKVTGVNPQSTAQVAARNRLVAQAQAWRDLTQAEQDAWIAATQNFKKTNIFGDTIKPSGFNLHNALNTNLDLVGVPPITDAPAPIAIPAVTSVVLTMANGADTASIAFAPTPVAANFAYLVMMTAGISAGRNFVKSEYRFIDFIDAADVTPEDIKAAYVLIHGSIPPEGMKVFCKLIPVSKVTGQRGIALSAETLVAA